ncbi:putative aspartic protease [Echria macrotheca]|uniref:Aspartic protease n=1 Tax=Echria macrotheca TaxID=438768 RepID=A0AAJ0BLA7_9PEZI|nr:putative aspartic protease [Echria macrotheca]
MSLVLLLRSAALYLLFATAASAHLLVPFTRQPNLHARSSTGPYSVPVAASGHVFVVNVTVGTPPQPFSLLLAPSSPHTWVPSVDAMPCKTGYDSLGGFHSPDDGSKSACGWGVFDPAKSSTTRMADQIYLDFVVAYTDTINVSGVNMTEKFVIGDVEIDDLSMGLVTSTSNQQWIGMLGLGNDATTNFPRASARYRPNFIDRLVSSGKITSQGYSIWLDTPDGASGSLLLGAIDKSRYDGDLIRLNAGAEPYDVFPSAFRASLVSVNVDEGVGPYKYTDPPILASISPAETLSYLPDALVEGIMAATGAVWNSSLELATIACDAGTRKPKTNIRIQLEGSAGPTLQALLADLIVPQDVSGWEIAYDSLATLNRNTCLFGIQKLPSLRASSTVQYNIGSSLLRRTYMVFDAANKDVALAPVLSTTGSKPSPAIVPFDKPGARIPSSKLYCVNPDVCGESDNPSTSASGSSGSGSGGGSGGGASSGDDSPQPDSSWKKIVIGVVVPIVTLAILVPIAYVLTTRRRRKNQEMSGAGSTLRGSEVDEDDNFKDDEYGVKVTVSVSGKVSYAKPPSPPELFLGLPGALPIIPEERNSQYWGDGVLRGTSTNGSGRSGSGGSEVSGGGSAARKEVWDEKN